ncbi:MAG: hypothetical protein NZ990_04715 [Myxococcota bacterium]|nr:hypothetical protein [Myxococcota bacterium]
MSDSGWQMRGSKLRWAVIVLFFATGLILGWWTASDREPAHDASRASRSPDLHSGEAEPGSEPPRDVSEDEALSRSLLEALVNENLGASQGELARLLGRFSGDPGEIAGVIIDSMSEQELISSITSFTDISPEKIQDSPDPHAYANRLVELAMEELVRQPSSEMNEAERVHFSERSASEEERQGELTTFAGNDRILARFPMKGYQGSEVFVKWTRVDDPQIMLFNHYPIKPDAAFNYVWLEPKNGWEPGDYQVNFYTADDRLIPLATGRYTIDPGD